MARKPSPNDVDVVGKKFGRLRVLCIHRDDRSHRWFLCVCDCGSTREIIGRNVIYGTATSCGCYRDERVDEARRSRFVEARNAINRSIDGVRGGAKKRGLTFTITGEECVKLFEGNCHYCGIQPSRTTRRGRSVYVRNGIDRVDNARGYEPDNVVSCCTWCNYSKRTMSAEAFVANLKRAGAFQLNGVA